MYSIKNVLLQSPEKVSAAVISILNVAVIAGWVHLSKETLGGLNVALVLALGLFYVNPLTISRSGLSQINQVKDQAHNAGVQVGMQAVNPPNDADG